MNPDKNIPASTLFRKLLELPRPNEVVDFPRKDADGKPVGRLRIQVLTQEEHDRARENAHRAMKQKGFDKDDMSADAIREVTGDTTARELLAMACLTEDGVELEDGKVTYGRIFSTGDDLRKLGSDEIAVLFNHYLLTQAKWGPFESSVSTTDELNAWITRLVEGGSSFPLSAMPWPALVELTMSLAARTYSLYEHLAYHRSSLPPILASDLASFSTDTSWSGRLAVKPESTGSESSDDTAR